MLMIPRQQSWFLLVLQGGRGKEGSRACFEGAQIRPLVIPHAFEDQQTACLQ